MLLKNYKFIIFWILIIIILIVFNHYFKIIIVSGRSMFPTLDSNQVSIASKKYNSLNKNDIVVFKHENTTSIKRIVAITGDSVILSSEGIYINNIKILDIPYNGENKEYNLADKEIFVLGDNYIVSYDSRDFGPINISEVIAKVQN